MNWSLERMTAFLIFSGIDPATGERIPPLDPLDFIPPSTLNVEALDES